MLYVITSEIKQTSFILQFAYVCLTTVVKKIAIKNPSHDLLYLRPQQFPSKFGTLPQISARNSPEVTPQNQLVPLNKIDGLDAEEKVRQLETRINVTERSNRALLEEVVRLQSELKGKQLDLFE